jgi:hypothetical protein
MNYEKLGKFLVKSFTVVGVISLTAGVGLLLAFPIKWTWNVTMPYLFSLPTITWGKAWCLNFLAGCLIKLSNIKTK